jgi:hypothetical protein
VDLRPDLDAKGSDGEGLIDGGMEKNR